MRASVPEPEVFAPGVISTDQRDYDVTFTPDGREAYFTRRSRRGPPRIYATRWSDGAWTEPQPAPFSTDRDEGPSISADGSTLVFSSRRPLDGHSDPGENIWLVHRTEERWSDPEPLAGPVNQPLVELDRYALGTEMGPTLLRDGSLLYWTRADPEWGSDLYVSLADSDGGFEEPRPLRINSFGEESNPVLSPDGRYLIFQAYRDGNAFGGEDLYVSERTEYGWRDPVLLPEPINSEDNDGWPSFSPDGRHFFFASDRDSVSGSYDVYWVDVASLRLGRPSAPGGELAAGH